jgi:hypothetical protein
MGFGGVGHTYTNPAIDALERPGFSYNKLADRRSWAMMLAFPLKVIALHPIKGSDYPASTWATARNG